MSLPNQFGSAAFVGITFGLVFTVASSGAVSMLGLHDEGEKKKSSYGTKPSPPSHIGGEGSQQIRQPADTPPKLSDTEQEKLDALLANLDSTDPDLGTLARQGWRDSPNTKRKRRSAAASQIDTILEEEDDDSL